MPLYKYMTLEKAFDLLKNKRLLLSDPSYFNDPFDSRPKYDYILSPGYAKYINNLQQRASGKTDEDAEVKSLKRIDKIDLNDPNSLSRLKSIFYSLDNINLSYSQNYRIASFSCQEGLDEQYFMWSMYADSHKGVRIKFSDLFEKELAEFLKPVQYRKAIPDIMFERSNLSIAQFQEKIQEKNQVICSTKSKIWEYEQEKRIIIPTQELLKKDTVCYEREEVFNTNTKQLIVKNYLKLNPEWIADICFGALLSKDNQDILLQIIHKNDICSKAVLNADDYGIIYIPYSKYYMYDLINKIDKTTFPNNNQKDNINTKEVTS